MDESVTPTDQIESANTNEHLEEGNEDIELVIEELERENEELRVKVTTKEETRGELESKIRTSVHSTELMESHILDFETYFGDLDVKIQEQKEQT